MKTQLRTYILDKPTTTSATQTEKPALSKQGWSWIQRALWICFVAVVPVLVHGQQATTSSAADPALAAAQVAEQLYNQGKFADAAEKYKVALTISANLESAQMGLARSLLAAEKPDDALKAAVIAVATHPNSAPVLAVSGEIKFRLGRMDLAERDYLAALKIDPQNVKSYVGLSRLYDAFSLRGRAYLVLKRAHEIDPKDPDVQLQWLETLPPGERVAGLRNYLSSPQAIAESDRIELQQYLRYLEATADRPAHTCRPTSGVQQTDVKLERLPYHPDSAGVEVKINGREQHLVLDSGASGITISRKAAQKAQLQRISDVTIFGIGDKGDKAGYLALADRISIDGLEFNDCLVTVSDKKVVSDDDGLVGTNVFESYLIDLDLPKDDPPVRFACTTGRGIGSCGCEDGRRLGKQGRYECRRGRREELSGTSEGPLCRSRDVELDPVLSLRPYDSGAGANQRLGTNAFPGRYGCNGQYVIDSRRRVGH